MNETTETTGASTPEADPIEPPRYGRALGLVVAGLFAVTALLGLFDVCDPEFPYHRTAGRDIVRSLRSGDAGGPGSRVLSGRNPGYAAAAPRYPMSPDFAAFSTFTFMVANLDVRLVVLLRVALLLILVAGLVQVLKSAGGGWWIPLACGLMLVGIEPAIAWSPRMVSIVMVATYTAILIRYLQGRTYAIWTLPVLQVVWANSTHESLIGLVLPFAMGVGLLLDQVLYRRERGHRVEGLPLLVLTAIAALFGIITPGGITALGAVKDSGGELSSVLFAGIGQALVRWKAVLSASGVDLGVFLPSTVPARLATSLLALTALASFAIWPRRMRLGRLLPVLCMAALAAGDRGLAPIFCLVAAPLAVVNFAEFARRTSEEGLFLLGVLSFPFRVLTVAALVLAVPLLVSGTWYLDAGSPKRFGVGVSEEAYPTEAARFLRTHMRKKLYNRPDTGSTLLWVLTGEASSTPSLAPLPFVTGYRFERGAAIDALLEDEGLARRLWTGGFEAAFLSSASPAAAIAELASSKELRIVHLGPGGVVFAARGPQASSMVRHLPEVRPGALPAPSVDDEAGLGALLARPRPGLFDRLALLAGIRRPSVRRGRLARLLMALGHYPQARRAAIRGILENHEHAAAYRTLIEINRDRLARIEKLSGAYKEAGRLKKENQKLELLARSWRLMP